MSKFYKNFALWHNLTTGEVMNAAQCRTRHRNPANYVYLGHWQPSQGKTIPYIRDGVYYRLLRGKETVFIPPELPPPTVRKMRRK